MGCGSLTASDHRVSLSRLRQRVPGKQYLQRPGVEHTWQKAGSQWGWCHASEGERRKKPSREAGGMSIKGSPGGGFKDLGLLS